MLLIRAWREQVRTGARLLAAPPNLLIGALSLAIHGPSAPESRVPRLGGGGADDDDERHRGTVEPVCVHGRPGPRRPPPDQRGDKVPGPAGRGRTRLRGQSGGAPDAG